MKRLYNNISKALLAVLCTIFAFICLLALITSLFLESWNAYDSRRDAFCDEVYRHAAKGYATLAMSDNEGDFNRDKLNKLNCYYGIIKDKYSENTDLSDTSLYLYQNFKNVKVPDNAFVRTYHISPETEYKLSDNFFDIWSGNQVIDDFSEVYNTYGIQGIGFDTIGQKAYAYANGKFYLLNENYCEFSTISYADEESKEMDLKSSVNTVYKKIWETNVPEVVSDFNNSNAEASNVTIEGELYIEDMAFGTLADIDTNYVLNIFPDEGEYGSISAKYVADLSPIHDSLSKITKDIASFDSVSAIGIYEPNPDLVNYTFVCFPKDNINDINDFFAQAKWFIGFVENTKYVYPIITIISFILSILCYIGFLCGIGHKSGAEEISISWLGKIWTDMSFAIFIIIENIIAAFFCGVVYYMRERNMSLGMTVAIFGIIFAAMMTVGLMWSANVAVNVKLHRFVKHSLCYRIFRWMKDRLIIFRQDVIKVRQGIKWSRRIWFVFIVITIIEFFILMDSIDTTGLAPLWAIEKVVFAIILHKLLLGYARIKEAATSLAAGDLSAKVELKGMPLFMAEHGMAMNEIQKGINLALEERTKSERMKAELITNVSHDIKTPLTSIINYVDLLEKEDIENTKAKEYLAVLSRQSARLKKLIEDLIEASKASTGNIKFNMESVNAGVLLNQSIGEFVDRLEAGNITLVTDLPEEEIYLTADNRYLWRVFDNLMSNIVKYAQSGTRAYIDLKEVDGKVLFSFRNTSKNELNISADELMERFVRGDKSRFTDGNGLGLSIAKSLTEAMGGKLSLAIDGDLFKAVVEFPVIENKAE